MYCNVLYLTSRDNKPHGCTAMCSTLPAGTTRRIKTNYFTHHCQAASLFGSPYDATAACARPLNPMPSTCSLLGCAPFSVSGTARGVDLNQSHAVLSDQGDHSICTLHGAYSLKDRDSRPKVWYPAVVWSTQLYPIKVTLPHTHYTVLTTRKTGVAGQR